MLVDFKKVAVIHNGVDGVLDVVRFPRIGWNESVERLIAPTRCVCSSAPWRIFQIIRGKKTHQLANHGQTIGIVTRNKMSHAAGGVVSHGAAQLLFGDFLVRHVFDDVGAGDEHVGSFASHENEISDRRGIDGAAGARAHDGANLGDDSAGKRIAQKNISVTRERSHTFLNACAPGIVEPDDGRSVAHGKVHDLTNLQRVGFGERAAEYGEVLRENVNEPAINAAKAGDEAVARGTLLLHAEIDAAVTDKFVQLLERAFVQQEVNALARREFTGFVFALAALGPAARFSFLGNTAKLFHAVAMLAFGDQTALGLRQGVLPRKEVPSWQKCERRDAWQSKWFRVAVQRQAAAPHPLRRRAGEEIRATSRTL